jgi:hypothetical protein
MKNRREHGKMPLAIPILSTVAKNDLARILEHIA